MSRFPLLRLPELAQINMLQQIDVIDLVTLSFCSHKAKELVRLAKIQVDDLAVDSNDERFFIFVNKTFWVKHYFGTSKVFLTGVDHLNPVDLFETSESPEAVAFLVIGHLMDTFRRVKNISVHCDLDNLLSHPIWNYRRTIKDLEIFPNFMKTANEELMNFIFNELTVTGHLEFDPTVAVGYQHSEGFQQEGVFIYHSNFVHFNAVLHSRSSSICLYEVPLPPASQFQTFLKLWMDKTHMENLKELEIRMESGSFTDSFWQQVINGIQYERVAPRTIKIRRIDGEAAEVFMIRNYFKFQVLID